MKKRLLKRLWVAVGLGVVVLVAAGIAQSSTLTVTSTADSGPGTLRQAILDANASAGPDEIDLPAGTYTLATDLPSVTDTLALVGAGSATTIIDAANTTHGLDVTGGQSFTLSGITVERSAVDGVAIDGIPATFAHVALDANHGRGVDTTTDLTVTTSSITNNDTGGLLSTGTLQLATTTVSGNTGVAVDSEGPTATLTADTISGDAIHNSVVAAHGLSIASSTVSNSGNDGIHVSGSLVMSSDTISASRQVGVNAFTDATITGTTVTGTVSSYAIWSQGGVLTLSNSTISGNGHGGVEAEGSAATLLNDTIAGNTGGDGGFGNFTGASVRNTIIAGNTPADCAHAVAAGDHSLDGDGTCGVGALSSTDPQLGPLQDNGGPTFTRVPASASPAVDAGNDTTCTGVDQRGTARPQGAHCDIGAVELAPGGGGGGGGGGTSTLTQLVAGGGSVTSSPAGISCPSTCSAAFANGASVTLTAAASAGNAFTGWAGDCSGATATCTVTMTAARTVEAFFAGSGPAPQHTLAVAVAGNGTVTSSPAGISCHATCSRQFAHASSVTLTAAPSSGSVFVTWSGDCSGSASTCTVAMDDARAVGAEFAAVSTGGGGGGPPTTTTPAKPVAAFAVSPSTPEPFALATLDASASTGAGLTYTWTFGDTNAPATTGVTVQHSWATGGTYLVTLVVVDTTGASDTLTKPVQVATPAGGPPPDRWIEGTVVKAEPFAPGGAAHDGVAAGLGVRLETLDQLHPRNTTTDASGHFRFKSMVADIGQPLVLGFHSPATGSIGDWFVGTTARNSQSLSVVDGVVPDGDHVLVEGTIEPPSGEPAGIAPHYEVRAFRADGTELTLGAPGGVGTPGRFRLALPSRQDVESANNTLVVLVLYENEVAVDSTKVQLPVLVSTNPASSQELPIVHADALQAVLPVIAGRLRVEGTVTRLAPFKPGGAAADRGFAAVSVKLAVGNGTPVSTVTDSQGHYAFAKLSSDFALAHARLTFDAGGGNTRTIPVAIGADPSTATADVELPEQAHERLVSGRVLRPTGSSLGAVQLKAFGDPGGVGAQGQSVQIQLAQPGGSGTYGTYRLGLLNPTNHLRIELYEGSTLVDSSYTTHVPGQAIDTVGDLHAYKLPVVVSRELRGHLTLVKVSLASKLVEAAARGTTVKLSKSVEPQTGNPLAVIATTTADRNGNYAFDHLGTTCTACVLTFFDPASHADVGSLDVRLGPDPSVTRLDARIGGEPGEVVFEGTIAGTGAATLAVETHPAGGASTSHTVKFLFPLHLPGLSFGAGPYALRSTEAFSHFAPFGINGGHGNLLTTASIVVSVGLGGVDSVAIPVEANGVQPLVEVTVPKLTLP